MVRNEPSPFLSVVATATRSFASKMIPVPLVTFPDSSLCVSGP